jgi:flavin reductase (DIM6/NTAB) family NADH-FMN oxidoreductase RutF
MKINPGDISPDSTYRLLTGIVVPRPIAWVTTISEAGIVNLAPFSCFMFLSSQPPLLGFTAGPKRGEKKDTARNVHRSREFVIHIADHSLLEPLHMSADEFPADVSEVESLGLATTPSETIRVPRLSAAPIALECKLSQVLQFGKSGSEFIVGEVALFHIRDGLCIDGKIDSGDLLPIGRLAGSAYTKCNEVVRKRPNRAMGPFEVI